jgi:hypothetical protein
VGIGWLAAISAAAGVLAIGMFRIASRPAAIRAARRRVQANLLAIRLYRDDFAVALQAQARVFSGLLRYAASVSVPFLALLIPFAFLFAYLDANFATRALHPGERAVVEVRAARTEGWRLEGDGGVVVETPPVRIPSRGRIAWRIRAATPGSHRMRLVSDGVQVEKEILVALGNVGAPARRAAPGLRRLLFAPAEPAIDPASGISWIEVHQPPLRFGLFGWELHWVLVFLAVSAAVALALRRPLGVEF